jgi:hypothetical protein
MAHDIFLSYSSPDKPVADAVCAALEADGIRCWIAPRDILPGSTWAEAIVDAIEQSKAMVVIFSMSANSSPQVIREVDLAVSKGVIVIPFRIEAIKPSKALEYFLSTPHWLDALTPPLERHIRQLVETAAALVRVRAQQASAGATIPAAAAARIDSSSRQAPGDVEEIAPDDWNRKRKKTLWRALASLLDDRS